MTTFEVSQEIQHHFVTLKRKKGPYTPSLSFAPVFQKCAEICIERQIYPELVIKAQAYYWKDKSLKDLIPPVLIKGQAFERYTQYLEELKQEEEMQKLSEPKYEGLLAAQKMYLKNQLVSGLSVEEALLDSSIDWLPWFPVLITKEPNEKIIRKYKPKIDAQPLDEELIQFLRKQQVFDLDRIL
jgi:hypothetical protein